MRRGSLAWSSSWDLPLDLDLASNVAGGSIENRGGSRVTPDVEDDQHEPVRLPRRFAIAHPHLERVGIGLPLDRGRPLQRGDVARYNQPLQGLASEEEAPRVIGERDAPARRGR